MKYHIVVKFLAIFLCAACLLGAVGCGAGMVVLTEFDLYNHTVDEVLDRNIQDSARSFAREAALHYASVELGGCSEQMASTRYWNQWHNPFYEAGDYGYVIRDSEGNVTAGSNVELAESGKCYSFPVSGQYMYLVSAEPESEDEPIQSVDTADSNAFPLGGVYSGAHGVYDNLPAVGWVDIYGVTVGYCDANGQQSSTGYVSLDSLGELSHDPAGDGSQVTFVCKKDLENVAELFRAGDVCYVAFQDLDGDAVYEASAPDRLGDVSFDFISGVYTFAPKVAENQNNSLTSVYLAEFYSMEDPEQTAFTVYGDGESAIGEMHYDSNGKLIVNLQSILEDNVKTRGAVSGGWVSGVCLYDADGYLILESRATGIVTLTEDGMLYYHTASAGDPLMPSQSQDPLAPAEAVNAQSVEPEQAEPGENNGAEIRNPEQEPEKQAAEGVPAEGEENPGETGNPEEETHAEETVNKPDEAEDGAAAETAPEEQVKSSEEEKPENPDAEPQETQAPEVTQPSVVQETAASGPEAEPAAQETAVSGSEAEPAVQETVVPDPEEAPEAMHVIPTAPPQKTEQIINGKPLSDYEVNVVGYFDSDTQTHMTAKYVYTPMPDYTVDLYVREEALRFSAVYTLLGVLRNFRSDLILMLGVSLLLFAICVVYLCCAAGHKPKQAEVKAGGLCRMPLDLNLGLSAAAVTGLAFGAIYSAERMLAASMETGVMMLAGVAYLGSLCVVQLMYCIAAQFKTPGGYWWKNSICGRILILCGRFLKWMLIFLPGRLVKLIKFLWNLVVKIFRFLWQGVIVKTARCVGSGIRKFIGLLPVMWQWLLAGGVVSLIGVLSQSPLGKLIGILACFALVLYASYCFGVLMKSAKRMGKGDLSTKVDDKRLLGCFREFAGDLNDLADVAVVAAQKQLKSERMKTELITNVSHDIKTPLTSIINYVDLLQKPHTEEEGAMYLEVLARQSQRLKKLIEDLMDMSKASTGNMSVDISTLNAVEAVNQALGEFGDKLAKAELIPVFRHDEPAVMMRADGKLVWRVLSNLLSNTVKYAMPGTRLYIDLVQMEGKVIISLKNISRDELNADSEKLMERFVRGDDSRNTEGSGLGLNIAKSLMELQKGQLELLVDGDLFKVTLIFPGA